MSIVLDASALVEVILDADAAGLARRLRGETFHAPTHIRIEACNVVRRRCSSGLLDPELAGSAFAAIMSAPITLWPFEALAERAWALGPNATTYDAAYLALAEVLAIPLVTHDGKLRGVPGVTCEVEVF